MLKRLRVIGYKSLRDTTVDFARLTVVFGPNAAGKSNLLDAISLLGSIVVEDSLDDAFRAHRGVPLEAFSVPRGGRRADGESASFTLQADVSLSDDVIESVQANVERMRRGADSDRRVRRVSLEKYLRYSITVEIQTDSGHLRVRDERLEALRSDGEVKASRAPFIDRDPHRSAFRLRHEGQGRPALEDILQDRAVVSKRLYAPHYPHIAALREEMTRWRFYFLEPAAMRTEVPLQETDTLSATGSDLAAFYNTLQATRPRQFDAFLKSLRQVVPDIDGLSVERTLQGTVRLIVHESGMELSSRLISEGTLRVLGLLAITNPLRPLTLIGYEEPENGIHATRLATVARFLLTSAERSDAQYILNTHSPFLPEYFQSSSSCELLRCEKVNGETSFHRLQTAGTLWAAEDIEAALEDTSTSSLSDRLLRGDVL